MQQQLKTLRTDQGKGKSSSKVSAATDELHYLMDFNSSIYQAMAKTMEHLCDFVLSPSKTLLWPEGILICLMSSLELNLTP